MMIVLFCLSLIGGFFSGLLGVGGAVILIPLLLSVPPLFGVGVLTMHDVAGITMIQVLASSATAGLVHRSRGLSHLPTILAVGIPMGLLSFTGAAVSKNISDLVLKVVFGCIVAAALLLLVRKSPGEEGTAIDFKFSRVTSGLCGCVIGFVSGMVGAGGGFVLVPVMTGMLKIPIKVAVGSSLGIVFIGALMGSFGKIVTLQVAWMYLLPVIAGSLPSSLVGAYVSRKLSPRRIRLVLLGLVFLIFVKTWCEIFYVL